MEHFHIRPLIDADWPRVWSIVQSVASTGETFTYPVDMDEALARAIWIEHLPGQTIVAANEANDILGTAKMGRNQMGPGSHVATASFMVDAQQRSRGIGRRLGEHAIDWARKNGFRSMQFNAVVETNVRAVALWRKLGFDIIGTVPEAFKHPIKGFVGLHVMHKTL